MEMTVKQNINKESVVLKHKIALEAATLLEDKENVLYTDIMIYSMVSLVDNFIEEHLIDLINKEDRDFAIIVEEDIEPLFNELVKDEQIKDIFDSTVEYVDEYLMHADYKRNTAIGLINNILDIIGDMNFEDLKFFFQDTNHKFREQLAANNVETKPIKQVSVEEYEGASDKMAKLIAKYQREGAKIKEQNNG